MLNQFKIGTKLALAFGVVVLLLLVMTAFVVYSYSSITRSSDSVQGMFGSSTRAADCVTAANQARRHFLRYLLSPEEQYDKGFDEETNNIRDILNDVAEKSPIPENQEEAKVLLALLTTIEIDKKKYVAANEPIDDIRKECNAISAKVREALENAALDMETYVEGKDGAVIAGVMKLESKAFRAQGLVYQILRARDVFVFSSDTELHNTYKPLLVNGLKDLKEQLDVVATCPTLPPGDIADKIARIIEDRNQWQTIAERYVKAVEGRREMEEPLLQKIRDVMAGVGKIQANVTKTAVKTGEDQKGLVRESQILSVGIAIAAAIGAVLMGWLLTVSVAGGIKRAVGAMNVIAGEGDVSFEISDSDLRRGDEVGDLAKALQSMLHQFQSVEKLADRLADHDFNVEAQVRSDKDAMNINLNKMFEEVSNALREINESAGQVASSSSEVAAAAENLSSGAQEIAASLEEITASIQEVGSQTKTNAESAVQASDLARQSSKVAAEGQTAMHGMIAAMERITSNSNEIQRVIKVVDDIAFQTNLLALNAAVEAARAGQHGKGFAVVAEEVRNLASRSAKAARETAELIDKSSQEIDKGGEIATRTSEVFDTIVEQIKQTTDLVAGIAAASNEQAQGVGQISIGLNQIDASTQTNTASAEESASAASEMNAMAASLQQLVSQFKLRNSSTV